MRMCDRDDVVAVANEHVLFTHELAFADKEAVRQHFTKVTGLFKNLHYAQPGSGEAEDLQAQIAAADEAAPVASGDAEKPDEAVASAKSASKATAASG